jgi:chromosome segregation ATPase
VERESEQLKKRFADLEDGFQQRDSRMKNAEIDNDTYQRQLRESEYTIQDLEQKLESNLEQLALLQWELEEYKMHTQEQLERLHQ